MERLRYFLIRNLAASFALAAMNLAQEQRRERFLVEASPELLRRASLRTRATLVRNKAGAAGPPG